MSNQTTDRRKAVKYRGYKITPTKVEPELQHPYEDPRCWYSLRYNRWRTAASLAEAKNRIDRDIEAVKEETTIVSTWPSDEERAYFGEQFYAERTIRVRLSATFYNDHANRFLPSGQVIGRRRNEVEVLCNEAELYEMWSDANFYHDHPDFEIGLRSAARSMKNRIERYNAEDLQRARELNRGDAA